MDQVGASVYEGEASLTGEAARHLGTQIDSLLTQVQAQWNFPDGEHASKLLALLLTKVTQTLQHLSALHIA